MDAIKEQIKMYDDGLVTRMEVTENIRKLCFTSLNRPFVDNAFRMFEAILAVKGLVDLKVHQESSLVHQIDCETYLEDEVVVLSIDDTELIRVSF